MTPTKSPCGSAAAGSRKASVSPAALRATRDLLRRRTHLMRKCAALLAHIHNTKSQSNLPAIGKKVAYTATRDGVAERFPEPAVQQSIEVALARIGHDDQRLRDMELAILKTAQQPNAQTLSLLRTVPGLGAILSVVLLSEIHELARFPRVHDFLSYCRLGKGTKESAGKRDGTAGMKIGNAHLTWAFAEAAVLFLRANPAGPKSLTTREKKHGAGKALPLLAQQLGRAVYYMLPRPTACDMGKFLTGEGSG